MQGHYHEPITEDLKERFLDLIAQGFTRKEAGEAVGTTGTRFRRICNERSVNYDPVFAQRYQELTAEGGEHRANLRERLETAAIERGIASSDRLLEKALVIHSPDWEVFKPSQFQGNVNIEKLAILLPGLSNETLNAVIDELELKALPGGA